MRIAMPLTDMYNIHSPYVSLLFWINLLVLQNVDDVFC